MRDIGERVLNAVRDRFDSHPAGDPWEPLSDNAKRRKKRNEDEILARDGDLRGNLACRADAIPSRAAGPPSTSATTGSARSRAPSARPRRADRGTTSPCARSSVCGSRRNRGTGAGLPRRGREAMTRRRRTVVDRLSGE